MLLYFIFIFLSIIFYFVFFKTPLWISNITFEFSNFKMIYLKYIIKKGESYYITPYYHFRHSNYDGRLISNILKVKNFKLNRLKEINKNDVVLYEEHNIVTNLLNIDKSSFRSKYSKFANICGFIIKYILLNNRLSLRVGIIVSNRNNNNFNKGNYITFGFFKVYNTMTFEQVLDKYNRAINEARNLEMKNFSLYDLLNLKDCDVIFNSWRDLSYIQNKYSLELFRYENEILDKKHIKDFLLSKKKRKLIYLDYYDNNYIINKIDYLM